MNLSERINNDMIGYMKSRDTFSLGVIRMVKAAIQLEKINLKRDLKMSDSIILQTGNLEISSTSSNYIYLFNNKAGIFIF